MGNPAAKTELSTISQLPERGRALARGYIASITIRPVNESPEFSAIVTDVDKYAPGQRAERALEQKSQKAAGQKPARERSRLRLVWLGQRHVPGIDAGTEVRFEGMVAFRDGLPTIFNPRYEIIGKPEFQEYSS
ncbi:OB-fold nucleic acid binding domain-containing protein [Psychromicrobium lacuslunae]|uniref:DNA-binding protein n=1 Tax=Psychromicrobium lacuslunae TaxID=1618207 RepID=A0A0D4BXD6_9MICC|nr:OB-fold nucleic acid binding domain-containing protein [Psychromicrobium lacuslunae]AJT40776.1 hypothetical protein UM93_03220 [Psychromicrobium lacuslunae]